MTALWPRRAGMLLLLGLQTAAAGAPCGDAGMRSAKTTRNEAGYNYHEMGNRPGTLGNVEIARWQWGSQ